MFTSKLRVLAFVSLTATITSLGITAQGPTRFNIPFGFTAGQKTLDAGRYEVSQAFSNVLTIRSCEKKGGVMLLANHDEPGKAPGRVTMTFQRYGSRYFLAKVSDSDHGWKVPMTNTEKELIASRARSERYEIVADSRR